MAMAIDAKPLEVWLLLLLLGARGGDGGTKADGR